MGTYVSEKFIIEPPTERQNNVEVFVNNQGEVFIGEEAPFGQFFVSLSKEEWQSMKDFVDNQLADFST